VSASDAEVIAAMRCARDELGVTVEPGGATALAAVLHGRLPTAGRNMSVVLTGGNVDPDQYERWLAPESTP